MDPVSSDRRRLLLPELRLNREALENNVQIMAVWCREGGVELAPHIKTTMCRPIVDMQMAAGAWGVTVATVNQAGIARSWGYRKVLIAVPSGGSGRFA